MRSSLIIALGLALAASCVRTPESEPCTSDGRCLPQNMCVEGACVPCEDDVCPVSTITLVASGGGRACGADETCARFPRGALARTVEVAVARTVEVATNMPETVVSKVYAVRPTFVVPALPYTFEMRVTRAVVPTERVRIYTALDPRGPWKALQTSREGLRASATAEALGFFVLARDERPDVDLDGGVASYPDAAPLPPMDPVPGIGAPAIIPGGVLRSLHGIAWDRSTDRVFVADTDTSEIFAFLHTTSLPGAPTRVRMMSNRTFGLGVDGLGRVYMAEHGSRTLTSMMGEGPPTPVATTFQGQRFNGPTDVAIRSEGTVYFTDPGIGLAGAPRDLPFNGLFRRAIGGEVTLEWQGATDSEPRGVELSPDETILYATDTSSRAVVAWDVAPGGALSGYRVFARTMGSRPDGIAVDRAGNVYVGTGEGVEVYAPEGTLWGSVPTPTPVGGLAFGGPLLQWLYATSPSQILLMTVTVPGVR